MHNAEKYVEKAIQSVLNQTFTNFEYILIDDFSQDKTITICKRLIDERCKIILLEENEGPGIARNKGLQAATGEYILFLDADDWMDSTLFEHIYQTAMAKKPDLLVFGITEEYVNQKGIIFKIQQLKLTQNFFDSEASSREFIINLQKGTMFRYVWNKAYKRTYIVKHRISFNEFPIGEDVYFNIQYSDYVQTVATISESTYHYKRVQSGSAMGKYYPNFWKMNYTLILMRYKQCLHWNLLSLAKDTLAEDYLKFIFLTLQMSFFSISRSTNTSRKKFLQERKLDKIYKELVLSYTGNNKVATFFKLLITKKFYRSSIIIGYGLYILKNKLYKIYSVLK